MALASSLVLATVAMPTSVALAGPSAGRGHAVDPQDARLDFDSAVYTTIGVTVDDRPVNVRWYKEICYVANPVAAAAQQPGGPGGGTTTIPNTACGYQSMNVFVPESAFGDQRAPVYFAVNNSGWMASYVKAGVTAGASYDSSTSNVGAALKAGYVFVDVANRSRGLVGADGSSPGKAPAAAVDAKAAVRYLRLNDAAMPGSAERIVVNGTSGGGALASILGAVRQRRRVRPPPRRDRRRRHRRQGPQHPARRRLRRQRLLPDHRPRQRRHRLRVALQRPRYARRHRLQPLTRRRRSHRGALRGIREEPGAVRNPDGTRLTAATLLDTVEKEVVRSAETYLEADPAHTIPPLGGTFEIASGGPGGPPTTKSYVNDWIDVDTATGKVRSVDMTRYLAFVATQATLKTTPAFDAVGVNGNTSSRTETNLFGPPTQAYLNYTEYGWNHNDVAGDGSGLDDTGLTWKQYTAKQSTTVDDQVHLINPMDFVGTRADTAPNWYVRHGTRDRDTAFTVSVNLDRALAADKQVTNLDYRLAWNQPHAGNYDVPEAMAWIADAVQKAGAPPASPRRG
ncbi:hypothetical protein ACIQVF_18840 [Streptomyces tendae]|uniref:hypothetical protein n=1 Tax=Streptomyces tendae TaxID=1932 RepID=UPI00382CE989